MSSIWSTKSQNILISFWRSKTWESDPGTRSLTEKLQLSPGLRNAEFVDAWPGLWSPAVLHVTQFGRLLRSWLLRFECDWSAGAHWVRVCWSHLTRVATAPVWLSVKLWLLQIPVSRSVATLSHQLSLFWSNQLTEEQQSAALQLQNIIPRTDKLFNWFYLCCDLHQSSDWSCVA